MALKKAANILPVNLTNTKWNNKIKAYCKREKQITMNNFLIRRLCSFIVPCHLDKARSDGVHDLQKLGQDKSTMQ